MGITQALYTGVTGLSVMSDSMAVVANNIANANAKGFKYDRAEFSDLLSQDLSGGGSGQLGRGAKLSAVRTIHTQGGLAVTDRLTDMAVQGTGFFVVSNPKGATQEAGGLFYTRVGAFIFDKDGYLADPSGGQLMGYPADLDGQIGTKLQPLRIPTNSLAPKHTSKIVMNVNLDSRTEARTEGEFDILNPRQTSDFANTVDIFDSHGTAHAMTTYFRRMEDDEGITFQYWATVDANEVVDASEDEREHVIATGVVKFNQDGLLLAEEPGESSANFTKGAQQDQKIEIDFGRNIGLEEGNGVGVSSATASRSVTVFHSQNGFESGSLKSLKVELDGMIKGYFTNGVERTLGAIALASFENNDGLLKAGKNQFYATLTSGAPRIGLAQTGVRGSVYSSTLEESNVDLAGQFVNMIMTQRGFQANSRSITTTDSMIEEVVNMKR